MPILTRQTLVVAHRGASAIAPENTRGAFELAVAAGADGIELDVQPTADGVPVVAHDDTLDRMGHPGVRIRELTAEELVHDVGRWKGEGYTGERIPTLDEVLRTFGSRVRLFVEIKSDDEDAARRDAFAARVAALVAGAPARDPWILSFDLVSLAAAARVAPGLPRAIDLCAESWPAEAEWPPIHGLCVDHVSIDRELVERAHELGRPVLAWTVNDAERMRELHALGVDAILSDDPALARRTLDPRASGRSH